MDPIGTPPCSSISRSEAAGLGTHLKLEKTASVWTSSPWTSCDVILVPQLLGNLRWEVQGRPLSVWFYVGLPFLQSLPQCFTIPKHFQLLPIFALYDPYRFSLYRFYENPTLWWQVAVVVSSALLVAVHLQFTTYVSSSPAKYRLLECLKLVTLSDGEPDQCY